jgi:carboxyl-terminal processing protease
MKKINLKKLSFIKLLPVILLFFVFTGAKLPGGGGDDDIYTEINKNMDVFGRVYKEIALNYVDEIDPGKFMKAGIEGMLNTLDPYTNFLDESRRDEIDLITTGKYGGIGVTIGIKDSSVIVTEVLDGYSAQKEGIRKGDKFIEIEGTHVDGRNPGDIRALVKGEPGTKVNIKVDRGGRELDFTLTREEINLKNVTYKGIIDDGIGYIKLERFNKYAVNEVVDALTEFKSKGEVKGVVLDLRDNPGGLLEAAVGILDKFVDKGSLLLTTKGRKNDSEKKYFAEEVPLMGKNIPLVVLVNGNTASASEIVSGAIQDLDRGVILGTKTFGKGLVQIFTPLSYGNQLKITTQKYFTPSGRWIQAKNYFKENKYGVFKTDPYSSQTSFKTLDGRPVFAEGGITPDTVVNGIDDNELLDGLISQDMYFKFAEQYVAEHPEGSNFAMTDAIAGEFYSFLNREQFDYYSKAQDELNKLKKIIADKNYSEQSQKIADELDTEIKSERYKDFDNSKPVIEMQLTKEILRRYNRPDKEVTEAGMKEDVQLQAALSIIKDSDLYNRFLKPNN